jgi:hypothetical protein
MRINHISTVVEYEWNILPLTTYTVGLDEKLNFFKVFLPFKKPEHRIKQQLLSEKKSSKKKK